MPPLTNNDAPPAAVLPLRKRQRGATGQPRESGARRGSVRGVIDLHTHILPGIDDGPETIEGSLEIARVALAAGTGTLVATPHINRAYDLDPPRVLEAAQMLREALEHEGIELELLT